MNRTARAHQGETLDELLYRLYGETAAITERALTLNPGLADQGPILAEGTRVILPPPDTLVDTKKPTIQLWS